MSALPVAAPGGKLAAGGGEMPYVRPGDYRTRDGLGRLVPRNPFADAVTMFQAFPGLGGRFDRVVPASHLDGDAVNCVCGARVDVLEQNEIVGCPGGCGRSFVRLSAEKVRCAFEGQGAMSDG